MHSASSDNKEIVDRINTGIQNYIDPVIALNIDMHVITESNLVIESIKRAFDETLKHYTANVLTQKPSKKNISSELIISLLKKDGLSNEDISHLDFSKLAFFTEIDKAHDYYLTASKISSLRTYEDIMKFSGWINRFSQNERFDQYVIKSNRFGKSMRDFNDRVTRLLKKEQRYMDALDHDEKAITGLISKTMMNSIVYDALNFDFKNKQPDLYNGILLLADFLSKDEDENFAKFVETSVKAIEKIDNNSPSNQKKLLEKLVFALYRKNYDWEKTLKFKDQVLAALKAVGEAWKDHDKKKLINLILTYIAETGNPDPAHLSTFIQEGLPKLVSSDRVESLLREAQLEAKKVLKSLELVEPQKQEVIQPFVPPYTEKEQKEELQKEIDEQQKVYDDWANAIRSQIKTEVPVTVQPQNNTQTEQAKKESEAKFKEELYNDYLKIKQTQNLGEFVTKEGVLQYKKRLEGSLAPQEEEYPVKQNPMAKGILHYQQKVYGETTEPMSTPAVSKEEEQSHIPDVNEVRARIAELKKHAEEAKLSIKETESKAKQSLEQVFRVADASIETTKRDAQEQKTLDATREERREKQLSDHNARVEQSVKPSVEEPKATSTKDEVKVAEIAPTVPLPDTTKHHHQSTAIINSELQPLSSRETATETKSISVEETKPKEEVKSSKQSTFKNWAQVERPKLMEMTMELFNQLNASGLLEQAELLALKKTEMQNHKFSTLEWHIKKLAQVDSPQKQQLQEIEKRIAEVKKTDSKAKETVNSGTQKIPVKNQY